MKDISINDLILTDSTRNTYQPVYAFAHHKKPSTSTEKSRGMSDYLQIQTTAFQHQEMPLEITGDHMIFLKNNTLNPVPGRSVRVGDILQGGDDDHPVKVANVKSVKRSGIYAPLTPDGTFVVNGVKASGKITSRKGPKRR
jgi:hypothetical protein